MTFSPRNLLSAVVLISAFLTGCDDSSAPPAQDAGNAHHASAPAASAVQETSPQTAAAANASPPAAADAPSHSATAEAPLTQPTTAGGAAPADRAQVQQAHRALTLLDASEVQLDGASTLVMTFSLPLDPEQDFARAAHLVDKVKGKVDGAWELAPNRKELRLRHLEPERELILTVNTSLKAQNGETLDREQQKTFTTRNIVPSVGFASRGSLLPTRMVAGLPVMVLNVDRVDVNFFRIKPASLPAFIGRWQYGSNLETWQSEQLLQMADLVYTGRFDLSPTLNTREKRLLPLGDIAPLQQPGVYLAVMGKAGGYGYNNAATLFTLSDIGVSMHRYQQQVDFFTQSLENGSPQPGVDVLMLDKSGKTLASAVTDDSGRAQLPLPLPKEVQLVLARKGDQVSLLDVTLPALDLAEFAISGDVGYSKQLFMFGPRDLYRPGETLIMNALLRDGDGKPLAEQPVKFEILKPDGKVARTEMVKPQNGLYQLSWALPQTAATGKWAVCANTGDNQPRRWAFNVEDFMPERMALTIATEAAPFAMDDEVHFDITGRYLYGAPAAGNTLQATLFLRPLRDAVASLPGFEFGDINLSNVSRTLDELDVKLSDAGTTSVSVPSAWQDVRSPLRLVMQASLLESGGRPVTRRAQQAIWPAAALPGIRPQFAAKEVYDYARDITVKRPMVETNSVAGFNIVYASPQGQREAVSGLQVRLVRERYDYYWDWSDSSGWRSQFDQKDLVEAEQTLDIAAGQTGSVHVPVEWGAYRLEVVAPDGIVSSLRFWAGYSWQDSEDGEAATRPDRVALKIDRPFYKPGDVVKLHIAPPAAGKGYAMVESPEGPLWW